MLATRPGWARVRFRIRGGFLVSFSQIEERTTVADQKIAWHATEGPLKVSDGSWSFRPAQGGKATDLTYQADLGTWLVDRCNELGRLVVDVTHHVQRLHDLAYDAVELELGGSE